MDRDIWLEHLAIVLYKLAPQGVIITPADVMEFHEQGKRNVLANSSNGFLELKLLSNERYKEIMEGYGERP